MAPPALLRACGRTFGGLGRHGADRPYENGRKHWHQTRRGGKGGIFHDGLHRLRNLLEIDFWCPLAQLLAAAMLRAVEQKMIQVVVSTTCVLLMAMAAQAGPAESCYDSDPRCPHTVFSVERAVSDHALRYFLSSSMTVKPVHMHDGTFSNLLQACGSAAWFVLLYSPGCRGCKDFLQAWDRLAEQVTEHGEMR